MKRSYLSFCIFYSLNALSKGDLPNVVFILADDLGYNDVSFYRNLNFSEPYDGIPTSQTPNIDKLAKEGIAFTDFYCGAAVSSPSRAALLTGRNHTRLGIYNWIPSDSPMHLLTEEYTIAELMKDKGYSTAHFGKWHLSSSGMGHPIPNNHGFDYSYFTHTDEKLKHFNPNCYFRNGVPVGKQKGYACNLMVDEAIGWLEKRKTTEPFFINLWFNEPHFPLAAPDSLTKRHDYNSLYYGAIENMDLSIGRFMEYLKLKKMDDNTIVFFASDNGADINHSNDPYRLGKCFLYEGGVRIPFIVKWKNRVSKGQVSSYNGIFEDIIVTLSHLIGQKLPEDRVYDGEDLTKVIIDGNNICYRKKDVFFHRYFQDPMCMLREGEWVLLGYYNEIIPIEEDHKLGLALTAVKRATHSEWGFNEEHMQMLKKMRPRYYSLYNLKKDREQKRDLSNFYPEIVKRLKRKMLIRLEEELNEGPNWFE